MFCEQVVRKPSKNLKGTIDERLKCKAGLKLILLLTTLYDSSPNRHWPSLSNVKSI